MDFFVNKNSLISYLNSNLMVYDTLNANSRIVLQGIGYYPYVFAYIMDGEKLDFPKGTYSFFIYCKIPGEKRVYFAPSSYLTPEECRKEAEKMLGSLPDYIFEDRYLL